MSVIARMYFGDTFNGTFWEAKSRAAIEKLAEERLGKITFDIVEKVPKGAVKGAYHSGVQEWWLIGKVNKDREHVKIHRRRQESQGLKEARVWVPEEYLGFVKKLGADLRDGKVRRDITTLQDQRDALWAWLKIHDRKLAQDFLDDYPYMKEDLS